MIGILDYHSVKMLSRLMDIGDLDDLIFSVAIEIMNEKILIDIALCCGISFIDRENIRAGFWIVGTNSVYFFASDAADKKNRRHK